MSVKFLNIGHPNIKSTLEVSTSKVLLILQKLPAYAHTLNLSNGQSQFDEWRICMQAKNTWIRKKSV